MQTTNEWQLYENGKTYNRKIGLYTNVDRNERFYAGDQWNGVAANGLPTPVFNIFKRCINYFISAILSQKVKMQFIPINSSEINATPDDEIKNLYGEIISKFNSETLWERMKMDMNIRQALLDAALSADADAHIFWNEKIHTGQIIEGVEVMGDIDFEMVDNVNVMFGNPNDVRVETQPYILVSFRQLVSKLKAEAKANKVKKTDYDRITSDTDNQEQAGSMAKIELEGGDESGKTTAIIKYWRDEETGHIFWKKSTRYCEIIKEVDTGLTRYPVAHMNWDKRKNSYHGQAVGTGLIPNQIFINKMFAMVMLNLMHTAFPKVVYNTSLIDKWVNQIGQAIPVQAGEDMKKVATYLEPAAMSSQVMNVIDAAINYTKDLIGVTDAATGNIKADNHAAIIAVQQASFIPLENIKAALYQWVEDIGYIWLDMMIAKYGKRNITVTRKGKREVIPFDFNQLKDVKFQLKIEVGPSSYWSEITQMQTLDNLLKDAKIDFIQYLERVPDGMIPKKEDLISDIKQQIANNPPQPEINPTISIPYESLPPAGQIQLAQKIGIQLTPQDIAMMPTEEPAQTPIGGL